MQYDELGYDTIPESWVMLYEIDIRSVAELQPGRLTLKPQAQPLLLHNGAIGRIVASGLVGHVVSQAAYLASRFVCARCYAARQPAAAELSIPASKSQQAGGQEMLTCSLL